MHPGNGSSMGISADGVLQGLTLPAPRDRGDGRSTLVATPIRPTSPISMPETSPAVAVSAPSPTRTTPPPGDRDRRRALFALLLCVVALPASWLLFSQLERLWPELVRLEGLAFLAAATLLGGAMAIGPLAAAIGLLVAVWFGVRSVYSPRSRATPLLDRVIVGAGLLVWFAPALAAIAQAVLALTSGRIHFVRPPRDYFLATDPIAFWQGVGFWLIIAALAGFLAWRYWQPKLFPAETATREA
ncbi:hypothetical protein [Thauera phenylacetica]|uniref:hypothetical protein n=1 Tax=Thauera phenylacetica TaxID=164400 RepID=UPI001FE1220F|nr:hypothetical protein [Thauera phenylacetica]